MYDTMRQHAAGYIPFLVLGLIGCYAKYENEGTTSPPPPSETGVTDAPQKESRSSEAAGRSQEKEAVYEGKPTSYWVAQLRDTSWRRRSEAVNVLAVLGPSNGEVIPALLVELKHKDPFDKQQIARTSVAATLGIIGAKSPEVASALVERLRDTTENQAVRCAVVLALGKSRIDNPDVVAGVIGALKDAHVKVRIAAANSLTLIGSNNTSVKRALVEMIDESEATLKAAIAKGSSVALFSLQRPDKEVQVAVAKALDGIAPGTWEKELTARLIARLNDPNARVRRETLVAIYGSGNLISAFDPQGLFFRDEESLRLRKSFTSVSQSSPKLAEVLLQLMENEDMEIRIFAKSIFRRLPAGRELPQFPLDPRQGRRK
jgi:HEAT repeat protein